MPFEHRDIISEKHPPQQELQEMTRSSLFLDTLTKALENFSEARKEKPKASQTIVGGVEFFFKKSWDSVVESVLEYDNLLKDIETKQWESKGAKSRAFNNLNEARSKALTKITAVAPDFENLDQKERRKRLAKIYQGFAEFVSEKKKSLELLTDDISGWMGLRELQYILGTRTSDRVVAERMRGLLDKKGRRKERRQERQESDGGVAEAQAHREQP